MFKVRNFGVTTGKKYETERVLGSYKLAGK
jgi:hypothetical protein